jgi:predicted membrane-bound spermidine synthase
VFSEEMLRKKYDTISIEEIPTDFLTDEIIKTMLFFGKDVFEGIDQDKIDTNSKNHPVLFKYYDSGRWEIY